MTDTPKKSEHFVLIMDQKYNAILQALYTGCVHSEGGKIIFNLVLQNNGITKEDFEAFLDDWSEKEHTLGWCRDPKCNWKPKEKKT